MNKILILQKITLVFVLLFLAGSANLLAQEKASYMVKQGDTLYNISKRLDVTIAELKEWNSLTGNEIELGQELIYYLPKPEIKQTEELPDEPSDPLVSRSPASQNTFYTVKSGDTLYRIAQQHNMSLELLRSLNNLMDDNLRVGQKLAVKKTTVAPSVGRFLEKSSPQGIFSVYKLKSGERLDELLTRFKMTEEEFQYLNPEIQIGNVTAGQEITVLLPPSRKYQNPYLQKADLQDLGQVQVIKYDESAIGETTTIGELYNPQLLTAAHSNIALGSIIFIENTKTGNGVYVRVNDRVTGSGLKLSNKAFEALKLQTTSQPAVTIYTETE